MRAVGSRDPRCDPPLLGTRSRAVGGPDDLPQRQAHRPAPGAVLLLRQRRVYAAVRSARTATSSLAGPGSRRGATSPRTSSVYIQPSFEGGRNLSSVHDHLHLDRSARGRRHADDHLPHHRPERAPAARRLHRRALQQGGEQVRRSTSAAGQEKRPYQPLRADLVEQPAVDRARRGPGTAPAGPPTTSSAPPASSPTTWAPALRLEHKLDDVRLVTVKVGAYNGQGESLNDVNNKKSFGARGTVGRHGQDSTSVPRGSPTTGSSP